MARCRTLRLRRSHRTARGFLSATRFIAAGETSLCDLLQEIGIDAPRPKASLYLWAHVPNGYTSRTFADHLLDKTGVAVTPGTSYGATGEGYFRMSLTVSDAEVDAAVKRLRKLFALEPATAGVGQ